MRRSMMPPGGTGSPAKLYSLNHGGRRSVHHRVTEARSNRISPWNVRNHGVCGRKIAVHYLHRDRAWVESFMNENEMRRSLVFSLAGLGISQVLPPGILAARPERSRDTCWAPTRENNSFIFGTRERYPSRLGLRRAPSTSRGDPAGDGRNWDFGAPSSRDGRSVLRAGRQPNLDAESGAAPV